VSTEKDRIHSIPILLNLTHDFVRRGIAHDRPSSAEKRLQVLRRRSLRPQQQLQAGDSPIAVEHYQVAVDVGDQRRVVDVPLCGNVACEIAHLRIMKPEQFSYRCGLVFKFSVPIVRLVHPQVVHAK
jgi:hypothetical protein